jgi:ubiquinone/menaquinone biosynthesis C-methylase UbiE
MKTPWRHRLWRWFYDHAAFAYDSILRAGVWLRIGSEERVRRDVIGRFRLQDGVRILDIGCGTAANRTWLAETTDYIGVDFSRGMLRLAKNKCNQLGLAAEFVQADMLALPFRSHVAPVSIGMGVLQHTADCRLAVSEMERVTSSPGRLIVIDEDIVEDRITAAMDGKEGYSAWGEYFCIVREI